MRNFEITVPSWLSVHCLKLLVNNDEGGKWCVLGASAGTKSPIKQKSWNVYVNSKCKLYMHCIYMYSKLHFYFLFAVQYSIWLGLSVFFNDPFILLPTITPDNRQYTAHPTNTTYNICSPCVCWQQKWNTATAEIPTLDQKSLQGENGLWMFWELLVYDKELLMAKLRTASCALWRGGERIYHKTYTVELHPWI